MDLKYINIIHFFYIPKTVILFVIEGHSVETEVKQKIEAAARAKQTSKWILKDSTERKM